MIVLIVLAVIAAAVFMYMRSRDHAPGLTRRGQGPELRGTRGASRASRHDPMAEAVERHAQATDPHEAAEAELRLQAQANRVASDLHAQQASTLESQAGGAGRLGGRGAAAPGAYGQPADAYGQPADPYGQPAYDDAGRPVYQDGRPDYAGNPAVPASNQPVYEDEYGNPVYEDGTPAPQEGRVVDRDDGAAYYDEQGRPVYPEDRPRY